MGTAPLKRRLELGAARRQLEQRPAERAFRESQQQPAVEQEQQRRLPPREYGGFGSIRARYGAPNRLSLRPGAVSGIPRLCGIKQEHWFRAGRK